MKRGLVNVLPVVAALLPLPLLGAIFVSTDPGETTLAVAPSSASTSFSGALGDSSAADRSVVPTAAPTLSGALGEGSSADSSVVPTAAPTLSGALGEGSSADSSVVPTAAPTLSGALGEGSSADSSVVPAAAPVTPGAVGEGSAADRSVLPSNAPVSPGAVGDRDEATPSALPTSREAFEEAIRRHYEQLQLDGVDVEVGTPNPNGCVLAFHARTRPAPVPAEAPIPSEFAPAPASVEAALADAARARTQSEQRAVRRTEDTRQFGELVAALETCVKEGAQQRLRKLIARDTRAVSWEQVPGLSVTAQYNERGRGGQMELSLRRSDTSRSLAVCFSPGTYGVALAQSTGRSRSYPRAQDLALTRAPVVAMNEGQSRATVRVPVACASFELRGPSDDQPYRLERFASNSPVERLMVALCAGAPKQESEAQLAVWVARNDISWGAFMAEQRSVRTFLTRQRIQPNHARGAAQLLLESGIDTRKTQFFRVPEAVQELADEEAEEPVREERQEREPAAVGGPNLS